jgi:hypothetical protein
MTQQRKRTIVIVAGALAAVLIALRVAAPQWVLASINDRLWGELGDYRGSVAEVDIHLWRGAVTLKNLLIEKASGKVPVPLLIAPRVEVALSWHALLRGGVVAKVHFLHPELTLVDGRGEADSQTGRGVDWRGQLERMLPIRLDEVLISDGVFGFRNFISDPQVDLRATQVEASIVNLTNVADDDGARPAVLTAQANILDGAPMVAEARFDPFTGLKDFGLDLRINRIHLPKLNDLFRAYALLDVESGTGDLVFQMEAQQGRVSGYVKPLFRDIKFIDWKEDKKNPLRLAWEVMAATIVALFKNQKEDLLATRIDFKGSIDDPNVGALDAIIGILHNAFVSALGPDFEKIKDN